MVSNFWDQAYDPLPNSHHFWQLTPIVRACHDVGCPQIWHMKTIRLGERIWEYSNTGSGTKTLS
jgi:hypothetical protein